MTAWPWRMLVPPVFGLFAALTTAGCLESRSIECGDRLCPASMRCHEASGACVSTEQILACDGKDELDACSYPGIETAVCRGGLCTASFCGNNVEDPDEQCDDGNTDPGDGCNPRCEFETCRNGYLDPDEQCDDGNALSHDGCSSGCSVEAPVWHELPPPWRPRRRPAVAYDAAREVVVLFGGNAPNRKSDTWLLDDGQWIEVFPAHAPSARAESSMVYDSAREVVILFGGFTEDGPNDETWEFDGVDWTKIETPQTPPPRGGFGMAYDSSRGVTVLFGGYGLEDGLNDTWEYDGNDWLQVTTEPSSTPGTAVTPAMAYDAARDQIVLTTFGYPGTIWRYTVGAWSPIVPPDGSPLPTPRQFHSLVYDSIRERVVLVGGFCVPDYEGCDDTWEFDGTEWLDMAVSPGPLAEAGLTYHAGLGKAVLVGGRTGAGSRDQTWLYPDDANAWQELEWQRAPAERFYPVATYDPDNAQPILLGGQLLDGGTFPADMWRFDHGRWMLADQGSDLYDAGVPGMWHGAYDESAKRLVIFGACTPWQVFVNKCDRAETWEQTSVGWMQRTGQQPPARALGAIAYHAELGEIILFGGQDGGLHNQFLGDTWRLTNDGWQLVGSDGPARQAPAMAYDRARQRLVMFGGADLNGELGDTWESDGSSWVEASPSESPPARLGAAMTYDAARQRIILFGGERFDGEQFEDLWEYDGTTWRKLPTAGIVPPARAYHGLTYDVGQRRVLLVGGIMPWDTWSYRYESSWPDEQCDSAGDEDLDDLADCADPDCVLEPSCR